MSDVKSLVFGVDARKKSFSVLVDFLIEANAILAIL